MKSKTDNFLIDDILPSIRNALKKEDKIFYKRLNRTKHKDFYDGEDFIRGVASYHLTERTLQYVIFKELCVKYRICIEDMAYPDSMERLDLSVYTRIIDVYNNYADIGIELKQVRFTKDDRLYINSLNGLIDDFDKIKKIGNPNKYVIIMGIHHKKSINLNDFNDYLCHEIDNRKFKAFKINAIHQTFFNTAHETEKNYYHIILLKVK